MTRAARAPCSALAREEGISIVGTDGARHTRLRNVLNRGFTPGRIAALAPRVQAIASSLAEPLLEAGESEFVGEFAVPLPVTVIAELLGVDRQRRDDFKRWSDAAMLGVFEEVGAEEREELGPAQHAHDVAMSAQDVEAALRQPLSRLKSRFSNL